MDSPFSSRRREDPLNVHSEGRAVLLRASPSTVWLVILYSLRAHDRSSRIASLNARIARFKESTNSSGESASLARLARDAAVSNSEYAMWH
jgi:hypothetical protein